jgi:hypothetical protein
MFWTSFTTKRKSGAVRKGDTARISFYPQQS